MLQFSKELLTLCDSVCYCGGEHTKTAPALIHLDRKKLKRLAKRHGLLNILYTYAQSNRHDNTELINYLKPDVSKQAIQNRLRIKQLALIFDVFNTRNIDYLLFKGMAVTAQLYQLPYNVLRPSADIDLLVQASDFPMAVNCLINAGYKCIDCDNAHDVALFAAHSPDKLCKRGLVFRHDNKHFSDIDLHWRMANSFSLPLPSNDVLAKKHHLETQGLTLTAPCFEHHFLLLCIHGYQDYFYQLKHLADIYFATQQTTFNETTLIKLAQEYGVKRHIEECLLFARYMFSPAPLETEKTQLPSYVHTSLKRYSHQNDTPSRAFKHHPHWSLRNKIFYIRHQISTRSRKCSPLAPISNRLLRSFHQI